MLGRRFFGQVESILSEWRVAPGDSAEYLRLPKSEADLTGLDFVSAHVFKSTVQTSQGAYTYEK